MADCSAANSDSVMETTLQTQVDLIVQGMSFVEVGSVVVNRTLFQLHSTFQTILSFLGFS
jgi:hypothetical protein